jgi:hypothetical protein
VDQVPVPDRELLNATLSCKRSDLPFLRKRLRDLIADFETVTHGDADAVYLMQMACIPLTNHQEKQ